VKAFLESRMREKKFGKKGRQGCRNRCEGKMPKPVAGFELLERKHQPTISQKKGGGEK